MVVEAQSMAGSRSTRLLWWALLVAGAPCGRLWPATFIPGDANSSGAVNVTDAVAIFRQLFLGDAALVACRAAADVDGNGALDLTDGIRLLGFLFLGGPPPISPQIQVPGCAGPDDPLGCVISGPCGSRGLFFVLDKSGSMNEGAKFKKLQMEVIRAIQGLQEEDEFAIVFYDVAIFKFPNSGNPARATAALKAAGLTFIVSSQPGRASCPKPAVFSGLNYARQSAAAERSIL